MTCCGPDFPPDDIIFLWSLDNSYILRRKEEAPPRECCARGCLILSVCANNMASMISILWGYFSFLKCQCCCDLKEESCPRGAFGERLSIRTQVLIVLTFPSIPCKDLELSKKQGLYSLPLSLDWNLSIDRAEPVVCVQEGCFMFLFEFSYCKKILINPKVRWFNNYQGFVKLFLLSWLPSLAGVV